MFDFFEIDMEDQKPLEREWDYLIILDACRFDIFRELYSDYFEGDLKKVESVGSSTPEWASKTFRKRHNITYFSSNPFINGSGVPINEVGWGSGCGYEWSASDHITTVIDVWEECWDEDLGTVLPEDMNEKVLENKYLLEGNGRTIIHYMQPHAPYIKSGKGRKTGTIRKSFKEAKKDGEASDNSSILAERVIPRVESFFQDSNLMMKLGMLAELKPKSALKITKKGTRETIEEYYRENLELVLEEVQELVEELDGDVVITSDHGEAFGEQGVWEHHIETHIPPLVEVPWLEVEGVKKERD